MTHNIHTTKAIITMLLVSSRTVLAASTSTWRTPSAMAATTRTTATFVSQSTPRLPTRRFAATSTTTTNTDETNVASGSEYEEGKDPDSVFDSEEETLQNLQSPFLITMRDRGFLFQCTNLAALDDLLLRNGRSEEDEEEEGGGGDEKDAVPVSAYLGFDATADSLHVGSLLQIMILRHLQKCGHRPVVLMGGGTSKVGDPTGKDESRKMLTEEMIQANVQGISQVFAKFLQFGSTGAEAIMVNNDEWLSSLHYLEFLRQYGTHFTINRMLNFESVKQRLAREAPLTFLEFNYMILQSYDFLELHRRYGVRLQLGGSDQWGNMVSGTELGRRVDGAQLFALTAPLITTSDGKKMGKTAGGAIWLNADRLSPYDYWQFWRNTSDDDVVRFLKLFTELPMDRIDEMAQWQGAQLNQAKIVLADEATTLLHGAESLSAIHETVKAMFSSGGGVGSAESLPRVSVTAQQLQEGGVKLLDLLVELKLATSKKDARRLISGGGAKLDNVKVQDELTVLTTADFAEKTEVTLRAGKKRAGIVEMKA